ncbi:NUDIX domain-containing protein [Streptomyces sp. NPDC020667]|uniref:NUDIX domain-containing protein n=1 Tax=Streptomyces sp. NPDC020667 TaxID=3154895 RepID=UPI0033F3332E
MTAQRHRRNCDVHILLIRDDQVLLSLRKGGYAAGLWQVLSGHLEEIEPTDDGADREGLEEIGIRLLPGRPRIRALPRLACTG